jgi:hypothetical protein
VTFLLIPSVLLINWTRFWVRESKAPLRYTYSIDRYEPLGETEPNRVSSGYAKTLLSA